MADVITPARSRRSWPQRLLIVFNVLCMGGALATAGVLGFSNQQLASVSRVGLKRVLTPAAETPVGSPVNYLIVGADEDTGLAPNDPVNIGRGKLAGAFRTDTIMVLRINPQDGSARVLSFPRDLWVSIPGQKYPNRINSAVDGGGALRLIETIKTDFGIPISHYVQVNFAGFKQLVTAIGGVPVYFQYPVRVLHSTPFRIPAAGCYVLDGNQALDYVRTREDYQIYRNGRFRTDLTGDLGRIQRQQAFIQVALKRAFAKGIRDPNKLRTLVDLGVKSVKIDDQLKTQDIVSLGNRFRNFKPENLQKYSVPATDAVHGGAQVLEVDKKAAEPILELFRGTSDDASAPAADGVSVEVLKPANVRVQVQNGGQPKGAARTVTTALTSLGFSTVIPIDAKGSYASTTVKYLPGRLAKARFTARFLTGAVSFVQATDVATTSDADVVVVIGQDWKGTEAQPKPPSALPPVPSTTTTAPATTTPLATTTTTTSPFIPTTPAGQNCG